MNGALRVLLVGAGRIAVQSHLPSILASPSARLAGIVDTTPERAAHLAQSYGLSVQISSRLDDMLGRADCAIIATPNHTHYELAAQCVAHGIPALIEKPMATSLAEASMLLELSEQRKVVLGVAYVNRFSAHAKLLRRLLAASHFGAVRRFAYQSGAQGGWAPYSGYTTGNGRTGGVLSVTGSHFLDRVLWFWGYPSQTEYADDAAGGPEANCVARVAYTNGFHGTIRCSKTANLPEDSCSIPISAAS